MSRHRTSGFWRERRARRRQAEKSGPFVPCPVCGAAMRLREGPDGTKFWGCSRFPTCRGTRRGDDAKRWYDQHARRRKRSGRPKGETHEVHCQWCGAVFAIRSVQVPQPPHVCTPCALGSPHREPISSPKEAVAAAGPETA